MEVWLNALPLFLLYFCRISSFFVVSPVFSSKGVPAQFKIGIAFFVSLVVYTAVGSKQVIPLDGDYVLLIVREILIGLALGFTAYLFFTVFQIAGSFIDMQMGLGIANVIDPMTGAQSPIIGNFKYFVAILLFLSINGHHLLLESIMNSYKWIPLDNRLFSLVQDGSVSDFMVQTFARTFELAFQLSAPLVVSMFLVDVSLGFLAKTAPQFNIFVVGVPIKIIVGFLILLIVIPGFNTLFQGVFNEMFQAMRQLLSINGKGS